MKTTLMTALLTPALAIGLAACSVEQVEEGEPPEIHVEPGQTPRYEVEPAEVDVGWDTTEVRVPDVDIRQPGDTLRR